MKEMLPGTPTTTENEEAITKKPVLPLKHKFEDNRPSFLTDGNLELALRRTCGTNNIDAQKELLSQIASISDSEERGSAFSAMLFQLQPENPLETMLYSQLLGIHNQTITSLSRLKMKNLEHFIDLELSRLKKLTAMFNSGLQMLAKLKNKEQKITVQHQNINVHDGGQAAVIGGMSDNGKK